MTVPPEVNDDRRGWYMSGGSDYVQRRPRRWLAHCASRTRSSSCASSTRAMAHSVKYGGFRLALDPTQELQREGLPNGRRREFRGSESRVPVVDDPPGPVRRLKAAMADARQYIRFAPLMARWMLRVLRSRIAAGLRSRIGTLRRLGIVIWCVLVGLIALHFGAANIDKAALSGYLISAAAMLGGTAAIVFSITIVLVQGSSDLYSSRHFSAYVNNWREVQPFAFIIAITIVFFADGMYVGGLKDLGDVVAIAVVTSLTLIGVVFALIDAQYENVRRKIRPAEFKSAVPTAGESPGSRSTACARSIPRSAVGRPRTRSRAISTTRLRSGSTCGTAGIPSTMVTQMDMTRSLEKKEMASWSLC